MDYRKVRNKLTVVDELLMFDLRLVVPRSLQIETLGKIHYGWAPRHPSLSPMTHLCCVVAWSQQTT